MVTAEKGIVKNAKKGKKEAALPGTPGEGKESS